MRVINLIPYIIKYDYEDMIGLGTCIVFAKDMDSAIEDFKQNMINRMNNPNFIDRVSFKNSTFRWVSKNIFGWNIYFNDSAIVRIKIREIDMKYGPFISINDNFEESKLN